MSQLYMSWNSICCSYIRNYVCIRLTAASVHSKNCPCSSVCVSYILKSIFCMSMHKVLSARCPGSGGSEEVRLRDGICGARDLVYFPPWIPVLPAGFSQVLASIRLGSWRRRGEGGGGGSRGLEEGEKEEGRATELESVTHNSAQLERQRERQRTGRGRE